MKNVLIKVIAVAFGVLSILALLTKAYGIIKLITYGSSNSEEDVYNSPSCFVPIKGIDELEDDIFRNKKIRKAELRKKKKELEKANNEILEPTNKIINITVDKNASIGEIHRFMYNNTREIHKKLREVYLRQSEILSDDMSSLVHFRLNDKKTDSQCKNEENSLLDINSCSIGSIPKDLALSRALKTPDNAREISPFGSRSENSTE